jgi:hypothetical protein
MEHNGAAATGFAPAKAHSPNHSTTTRIDDQQPPSWSRTKLISFRLTFITVALSAFRLVPNIVPGLNRVAVLERRTTLSIAAFVFRTATRNHSSIHDIVVNQFYTNNGLFVVADLFGLVVLAAFATAVWTSMDRHRVSYSTLNRYMRIYARYVMGVTMVRYALVKVIPTQFGFLTPGGLLWPFGQMTRFWVLWNFMAVSPGYTTFSGVIELFGASLLFFRRTTLLGILVLAGALTNVVAMDIAYGVAAVEIAYALLLIDLILLVPYSRALLDVLLGGCSALPKEPSPARQRWYHSPLIAGLILGLVAAPRIKDGIAYRQSFFGAGHPVYGLFDVTAFVRNGQSVTPLASDGATWKRLASDGRYDSKGVSVQFANADIRSFRLTDDTSQHIWTLKGMNSNETATLHYAIQSDGDVSLEGQLNSDAVQVRLHPVDLHKFPLWRP